MAPRRAWKSRRSGEDRSVRGRRRDASAHLSSSTVPHHRLPTALRPRKLPRQHRAKETVTAILQAAAELFAAHGYAGATTNRIAARAGVSIGSLYQYFPNKGAIIVELLANHHADVEREVAASIPDLENPDIPFGDGFRSLLKRLVDLHAANPALMRALSSERSDIPWIRKESEGGGDAEIDHLATILGRRPDARAGDPVLMAHLIAQSVEAMTRWLVHDAPSSIDRHEAVDEIVRMVNGYVVARS